MIGKIKQLRVKLDALSAKADGYIDSELPGIIIGTARTTFSEHVDALEYLKNGRMWLGKLLGLIGEVTPYKVAEKAEDIPAATDTAEYFEEEYDGELKFLNEMREDLKGVIKEIEEMGTVEEMSRWAVEAQYQAWVNINMASMKYGQALGFIRDLSKL